MSRKKKESSRKTVRDRPGSADSISGIYGCVARARSCGADVHDFTVISLYLTLSCGRISFPVFFRLRKTGVPYSSNVRLFAQKLIKSLLCFTARYICHLDSCEFAQPTQLISRRVSFFSPRYFLISIVSADRLNKEIG